METIRSASEEIHDSHGDNSQHDQDQDFQHQQEYNPENYADHQEQEHTDEQEQHELYEQTLKRQTSVTSKRSRTPSMASVRKSANASPLASQSMNFDQHKSALRQSFSNLSVLRSKDPYLRSINDLKYLGDQFQVGKINPNQKSVFEIRFEKMYASTLKKLSTPSYKKHPMETLADFRRTRDLKVILDPQYTLTNELKFTGDQFKVGKIDPKIVNPFEKRFQERFKGQLIKLLPNPLRASSLLNFNDLKEIHQTLTIPKSIPAK